MMANEEDKSVASNGSDDAGPDVELFDAWVRKHYGESSRTKTITNDKYLKICQLIRGEDSNTNAKFRFWVRSKGFRLISHDKSTDEVTDDPAGSLFVSLHAKEDTTPIGERSIEKFLRTNLPAISFFRKVAMVEEFYDIIKCAHVDQKGVHAGQKKTYRVVSDTYAFLPREVITFYLLNCNTCKPRIQKYGPIHSKVRMNNIVSPTINTEKSSAHSSEAEAVTYECDNSNTSQVIRPSPKIYVPNYMDETEVYSKIYESHLKPRNVNDIPTTRMQERVEYFKTEKGTYPFATKGSDQLRGNWGSRVNDEEFQKYPSHTVSNTNYPSHTVSSTKYPSHAVSSTVSSGLESTSPSQSFSIRSSDYGSDASPNMTSKKRESYNDIEERLMKEDERNTKGSNYRDKNVSSSYSEFTTCSGSCCAHLSPTLDYFQNKKEKSERYHGYRMEPYKLFQRNDNIRNYQERILEAHHNKDVLFHPHNIPYFAENKDKYVNLYREEKGWSKIDFPSSSLWHKTFLSGDIAESSWKSLSRQAMEKAQLKVSYRGTYQ